MIEIANELGSHILGGHLGWGTTVGLAVLVSLTVAWVYRHINQPKGS